MLLSDECGAQPRPAHAPCSNRHFIPVNQESQRPPPNSPMVSDAFQLVPFKTQRKESGAALGGSAVSASHNSAEASDVFLQAPFGKRQETNKAAPISSHTLRPGTQQVKNSKKSHPGALLHTEAPLLQQPVAVHRVVSRIGQQAAVGSVAVGPLHSWTIVGKAVDDPFTAAPFQPRYSQGKP
ncbi:uncharacterized protein V3H82_026571 [Fundulus diaphanus]